MKLAHKLKTLLAAILLSCSAVNAHAISGFVGGDLGLVLYPDLMTDYSNWLFAQPTVWSVTSTQTRGSVGINFRGGAWFNKAVGVEAGLDMLGSSSGTTDATLMGGGTWTETWKYTANAVHVAALLGNQRIFARVGLHNTSTTLDDKWTTGGVTTSASRTTSSTGILLGVGSNFPVGEHVALQVSFNIFNGVKFTDLRNLNNTVTNNLYRLSFGAAYKF